MTVKEEKNGDPILNQDTITHSSNKNDVSNRKERRSKRIIE
jgi:hypothetical protein